MSSYSSLLKAKQNKNILSWRLDQLGIVSWHMFSDSAFRFYGPA